MAGVRHYTVIGVTTFVDRQVRQITRNYHIYSLTRAYYEKLNLPRIAVLPNYFGHCVQSSSAPTAGLPSAYHSTATSAFTLETQQYLSQASAHRNYSALNPYSQSLPV